MCFTFGVGNTEEGGFPVPRGPWDIVRTKQPVRLRNGSAIDFDEAIKLPLELFHATSVCRTRSSPPVTTSPYGSSPGEQSEGPSNKRMQPCSEVATVSMHSLHILSGGLSQAVVSRFLFRNINCHES